MYNNVIHYNADCVYCEVLVSSLYRLAYGVWLLTEILEKCPKDVTLFMMYDVACHLVRHLRVSMHHSIPVLLHINSSLPFFISRLMVKQSFWNGYILQFLHSTFTVTSLLVRYVFTL